MISKWMQEKRTWSIKATSGTLVLTGSSSLGWSPGTLPIYLLRKRSTLHQARNPNTPTWTLLHQPVIAFASAQPFGQLIIWVLSPWHPVYRDVCDVCFDRTATKNAERPLSSSPAVCPYSRHPQGQCKDGSCLCFGLSELRTQRCQDNARMLLVMQCSLSIKHPLRPNVLPLLFHTLYL